MKYRPNVRKDREKSVTPLAGVWIEIEFEGMSEEEKEEVTPLAGVWIEILTPFSATSLINCHSPRGSVD